MTQEGNKQHSWGEGQGHVVEDGETERIIWKRAAEKVMDNYSAKMWQGEGEKEQKRRLLRYINIKHHLWNRVVMEQIEAGPWLVRPAATIGQSDI